MSHAADATEALRDAVAAPVAATDAAGRQFVATQRALRDADDLLPTMEAAVGLILALEALQEAAKRAEADARAALARTMSLGATTLRTPTHTVSLKEGVPGAIITDPSQVPRELWSAPEPRPDKTEIAKRLRRGEVIPGAVLTNGAPPTVQIKKREAA